METFGGKKRYVEPAPKHLIIPVETREEAVTLAMSHLMRPTDLRDTRRIRLEAYTEFHTKFFGGFPDDLHLFINSDWELPLRYKGAILKWLQEKRGWETERMRIKRARHPDGRLLTLEELDQQYSARTRHVTKLPRLLAHAVEAEPAHQEKAGGSG
jgi:CO dehydrogenase/acetyl-CoA synthase alpha subunit